MSTELSEMCRCAGQKGAVCKCPQKWSHIVDKLTYTTACHVRGEVDTGPTVIRHELTYIQMLFVYNK